MKTLSEGHYKMDEEGAIWINVRGFSINIIANVDGVLADIYDADDLDHDVNSEPLASALVDDLI